MMDRFKKFGGDRIPDIIEYLKEYIAKDPIVTISVGCDSIQRRRKTVYAVTVMLYNGDIKNGAHVIFFREHVNKIRTDFERLQKEAQFALEVAEMLNEKLAHFFTRQDLTITERKRYKYHLMKCTETYRDITPSNEDGFINAITLTDQERTDPYKLVDIHVDYNPFEGHIDKKGIPKNRSNMSYRASVPWLKSLGYRVFSKPMAHGATSAADLLLQD